MTLLNNFGLPADMTTNKGKLLSNLSYKQPVLLVFLRHFGCTFCREALADIAKKRDNIENRGVKIVFVHMSPNYLANRYFERYELKGIAHVSDPDCKLYKAYGLTKGTFNQLFGLKSWIRGFDAGVVKGNWVGTKALGDGFQMPGVFLIQNEEIKEHYIHKLASDRPDYVGLIDCCAVF